MNVSFKTQLKAMYDESESRAFPFVRRDKGVRARVLADVGGDMLLVATQSPCKEPRYGASVPRAYNLSHDATIRVVTKEYFDNNYWEGKS